MIKVHKLTVILTLLCLFCSCDRNDADIEIFRRADWQGEYEKYLNDNINDEYAAPAYGFDFLFFTLAAYRRVIKPVGIIIKLTAMLAQHILKQRPFGLRELTYSHNSRLVKLLSGCASNKKHFRNRHRP